jgi:hypothetical protein
MRELILALLALTSTQDKIHFLRSHSIRESSEWYMTCARVCGEPQDSHDMFQATMRIDEGTKLIVHTHSPIVNPRPSYADIKLAERTGVPDLVVSAYAMYIVWPDGKIEEVKY